MNKKVFSYFLTILISFMFICNVHAVSCADIDEKIDNYNSYTDQLEGVDCTDNSDEENAALCNDLKLKKNNIVTKLMKYKDEDALCSSNSAAAEQIISENSDNCGRIFDDFFTDFVNNVLRLFYIIGPVLLILLGTIDYTRATIESDEKALKKANQRFIRRTVATILLFLVPVITNVILSFNMSDYYLSGNSYSCNYEYLIANGSRNFDIKVVPKQRRLKSGKTTMGGTGGYGSILSAAQALHDAQTSWNYSLSSPPLTGGNIEKAIDNPGKGTCCATYVSSVLYKAGSVTESEINGINYNLATDVSALLQSKGWQKITSYSNLQAGDIVFMTSSSYPNSVGHVQIYAGDGTWYNAGGNSSIHGAAPYPSDASGRFLYAMRQ